MKKLITTRHCAIPIFYFIILAMQFAPANISAQSFSEQLSISLSGISNGSVSWGDFNNDGYLDILATGSSAAGPVSKIYKNNGDGTFSEQTQITMPGLSNSSSSWGDFNNDGYIDILLSGQDKNYNSISKIYKNNGDGSFSEQTSVSFIPFAGSMVAWGDYDNNGLPDFLIAGMSGTGQAAKLFRNSKDGNFTEQTSAKITGVAYGSAAWGDYDNDGDLDILLTGETRDHSPVSKIFRNEGRGIFTEQTSISLKGVMYSSASWGDYNNDSYLDILLTGRSANGNVSVVYKNNGNGSFTEQTSVSLTGVNYGSSAWGDYDNDGDLDILITGMTGNSPDYMPVSMIYANNGNGNFSRDTLSVLTGVGYSSAAWGDYDNDGKLDVLLSGKDKSGNYILKVFKNTASAADLVPDVPLNLTSGVEGHKVTFKWDKSTDMETPQNGLHYNVVIGQSPSELNTLSPMADISTGFRRVVSLGNSQTNGSLYLFLPGGTYYWSVQAVDAAFKGSKFAPEKSFSVLPSVISLTSPNGGEKWIPGSQHNITWTSSNTEYITIEYSTDNGTTWKSVTDSTPASSGSYAWTVPNTISKQCKIRLSDALSVFETSDSVFSIVAQFEPVQIPLTAIDHGSAAWGDFNNDGFLDILLTGRDSKGGYVNKIYKNNGNGKFPEETSILLSDEQFSSAAWGDFDNDGNADALLSGNGTKIFKNNGDGSFSEMKSISFPWATDGSAVWGDYNNDGYADILLFGYTFTDVGSITKLYMNNGNNTFTEQKSAALPGIVQGSAAWGDYDRDGYLDILLTGNSSSGLISRLYRNNGNGSFTEQMPNFFTGLIRSSALWGDYDNDGYLDIFLSGWDEASHYICKVYRNIGNGTFTEQKSIVLPGAIWGSMALGDYDNDGYSDILLTGNSDALDMAKVFKNNGNGTFSEQTLISLTRLSNSSAAWGDYDNDGRLDILLTGTSANSPVSVIYHNNSPEVNTTPDAPSALASAVSGNRVTFSWNQSSDKETPATALNYNIVIGTTPNGISTLSPLSDRTTGFRRIVKAGTIQSNTQVSYLLPEGSYYWSVQAVDGAFAGSKFAPEQTFAVKSAIKITSPDGGENWVAGTEHNITWTSGKADSLKIEFTTDNGINWSTITAGTPTGSSTFAWTLPFVSSKQCRVRVSGLASNSFDISDSAFTIMSQFEPLSAQISDLAFSSAVWGDYDNDGDLDILLSGWSADSLVSKIYKNDGNSGFIEQKNISLPGLNNSSAAWGDFDNDGYLDFLMTGQDKDYNSISEIFRNNGDGTFSLQTSVILTGVSFGSSVWGDFDNDGYLDILLTGRTGKYPDYVPVAKIYRNNRNRTFTEQTSVQLPGVWGSSAALGDLDNDGYLDILLTGSTGDFPDYNHISKIYKNNGDWTFSEKAQASLKGVGDGSVALGDYDNDGDLDILLTGLNGMDNGANRISKIYRNDGRFSFSELTSASFPGVRYASAAWGDYNNDGYQDILMTGDTDQGEFISMIYKNNKNGSFTEVPALMTGVNLGSAAWGDYDNDGRLDILLTGASAFYPSREPVSRIYKNNFPAANTQPSAPLNPGTELIGSNVLFRWSKSEDKETAQNGLSYNLVIGITANGADILSPMSDIASGYRRVVRQGSLQSNSFTMKNLPKGTYYWRVQAIDAAFSGSGFSEEKSFTVDYSAVDEMNGLNVTEYSLRQNYPNPFNPVCIIKYGLPVKSSVKLLVYNSLGEVIKELVNSAMEDAGLHEVKFNAGNLSSGVYFYCLEAAAADKSKSYRQIRKMVLLK